MLPTHQRLSRTSQITHQLLLRNHQNGSVRFEVDPLTSLDRLETFDCDVLLIAQAQTDHV
jgi:hypothetical protein